VSRSRDGILALGVQPWLADGKPLHTTLLLRCGCIHSLRAPRKCQGRAVAQFGTDYTGVQNQNYTCSQSLALGE